jgi:PAS domain S-box-containing protein
VGRWSGLLHQRVKTGESLIVESHMVLERSEGREEVLEANRDRTEQERAAEALRASNDLFRGAFEHTNVAMVLTGLDNRFVRANAAFARMFGYSREEMLQLSMMDITHPDDVAESLARRSELLAGHIPYFQMEKRYRDKNGRVVWGLTNVSLVRDVAGKPQQYVGQVQDITERKRAEEANAKYMERLRIVQQIDRALIAGESPAAIAGAALAPLRELLGVPRAVVNLFDLEKGQVEWLAAAGRRRLHIGPGVRYSIRFMGNVEALRRREVQSIDVHTLPPGPEVDALLASGVHAYVVVPMIAAGELIGALSFGGETMPWSSERVSIAQEAATQFAIAIAHARLVERVQRQAEALAVQIAEREQAEQERKRLENQFRQAQKMEAVGQLAGGVAHDFNNLLTIINGYSEIVRMELPADNPMRDLVREIGQAGERAASLTRQLLAFSRKQVLAPRVFSLNATVTDTSKMLKRLLGEDIDLVTSLDPALGQVKADPGQIEQILINLAVNARDAMPRGGKLMIDTANVVLDEAYTQAYPELRPGPYVMLAVSDTGTGMDETVKARIFEPFFTTKEAGKGTGLGLATVFGIVKQSGGHISVSSELTQGATFKVYLPRVEEMVSTNRSSLVLPTAPRGNETILLAEDEPAVLALTRHVLEVHGYTVLEANNPDKAIRLVQEFQGTIHLLVTDVVMPIMSGRQLAECIIAFRPDIKVLYLSGYTDDAVVRHGVLQAETAFLQKPFSPTALAQRVREVLDG